MREDVNSGSKPGARLAFRFEPNENLTITPRVVYQKLETDGYPRIDVFNILGNTYTTTQPQVNPGERGQVTQFREGITDDFLLGDLKIDVNFGENLGFTSVSSYIDRQVEVLRDASQLTGSVTIDLGGTDAQARLDSPLYDNTDLQVFSQELRLASTGDRRGTSTELAVHGRIGALRSTPACDSQLLCDATRRPGSSCPRRRANSPIAHGESPHGSSVISPWGGA